jgi:hypothetical protein
MTVEEAAAQLNYIQHFYQGGLSLVVKSPIRLPPDTFFRLLLLTLLAYQQNNGPPTSMGTDDGVAPYLPALFEATPRYTK